MNDTEVLLRANELLIKINVITGWSFPMDTESQIILKEQFYKKLKESYSHANLEEIEYAFRSNTSIKDWGKSINLFLIDEVMIPYLQKRFEVSEIERGLGKAPQQKLYSEEDLLNQRREEIETFFQALKKGYRPLVHNYFSEVLIQDGIMQEGEDISEFLVNKLATVENLYLKEK